MKKGMYGTASKSLTALAMAFLIAGLLLTGALQVVSGAEEVTVCEEMSEAGTEASESESQQSEQSEQESGASVPDETSAVETDTVSRMEFSKCDSVTKEALPGAALQLICCDRTVWRGEVYEPGSVLESWVSTKTPHQTEGLAPGRYLLREAQTPYGYQRSEDLLFEVKESDGIRPIIMEDARTCGRLMIYKYQENGSGEPDTDNPMEQVEFRLYYAETVTDETGKILYQEGEPVKTAAGEEAILVTDENGYAQTELLPIGVYNGQGWVRQIIYRMEETKTPAGNVPQAPVLLSFDYENDSVPVVTVTNTLVNLYTKVEICSVDAQEGFLLSGGRLQVLAAEDIYDDYGNLLFEAHSLIKEWVPQEEGIHFIRVPQGNYLLRQIQAPEGYIRAADTAFAVEDIPSVQSVTLKNKRAVGRILVQSCTEQGTPISGAVFCLMNEETQDMADILITDENGQAVSAELPVGVYDEHGFLHAARYEVKMESVPVGYIQEDKTWSVVMAYSGGQDEVKEYPVRTVIEYTKAAFVSQDVMDGRILSGAVLSVIAEETTQYNGMTYQQGDVLETWTTEETPHLIERLPAGVYRLEELTAPDGYEKVQQVSFCIENIGTLQLILVQNRRQQEETAEETTAEKTETKGEESETTEETESKEAEPETTEETEPKETEPAAAEEAEPKETEPETTEETEPKETEPTTAEEAETGSKAAGETDAVSPSGIVILGVEETNRGLWLMMAGGVLLVLLGIVLKQQKNTGIRS